VWTSSLSLLEHHKEDIKDIEVFHVKTCFDHLDSWNTALPGSSEPAANITWTNSECIKGETAYCVKDVEDLIDKISLNMFFYFLPKFFPAWDFLYIWLQVARLLYQGACQCHFQVSFSPGLS
jgi:hypothetical protein